MRKQKRYQRILNSGKSTIGNPPNGKKPKGMASPMSADFKSEDNIGKGLVGKANKGIMPKGKGKPHGKFEKGTNVGKGDVGNAPKPKWPGDDVHFVKEDLNEWVGGNGKRSYSLQDAIRTIKLQIKETEKLDEDCEEKNKKLKILKNRLSKYEQKLKD